MTTNKLSVSSKHRVLSRPGRAILLGVAILWPACTKIAAVGTWGSGGIR